MRKLEALRRLSAPERRLLLCALAALPAVALGVRFFGLRRVQSALAWRQPAFHGQALPAARADALAAARLVDIAARHGPYKAKCLPRSLVLQWLLARRGVGTALRVGVRKTAGAFEAHAWLEHEGHALIDGGGVHDVFAAFDGAIPPPGASLR